MVRLLHAKTSKAVDDVLHAATRSQMPFLLLVYSDHCGHCVRMMPAFHSMLEVLGAATKHDVVKIDSSSLRGHEAGGTAGKPPHPLRSVILSHVIGVPFVAVMKPTSSGFLVVPLPDSNDRSATSMAAFAKKHLSALPRPAATKRTASPVKKRPTRVVSRSSATKPIKAMSATKKQKQKQKRAQ